MPHAGAATAETDDATSPLAVALRAQADLTKAGELLNGVFDVLGDNARKGLILSAKSNQQGVLCRLHSQAPVPLGEVVDALLERAEALLALDHPHIRRANTRRGIALGHRGAR